MDLSAQVAHELLARIIIYNIEKTIMKHQKLMCVVEGAARVSFSQPFLTPPIPFSLSVRCILNIENWTTWLLTDPLVRLMQI